MAERRFSMRDVLDASLFDLDELSDKELRQLASRGASVAKKRVSRLESLGYESPAVYDVGSGFKKAIQTVRGKSRGELIQQIQTEQQFLRNKLSTVSGLEDLIQKVTGDRKYARARSDRFNPLDPRAFSQGEAVFEEGEDITSRGMATTVTKKQAIRIFNALHKINDKQGFGRGSLGSLTALQKISQKVFETRIADRNKLSTDALASYAEDVMSEGVYPSEEGIAADIASGLTGGFTTKNSQNNM